MPFYYSEKGVASYLKSLLAYPVNTWQASLEFESKGLSDEQKAALKTAMSHPVSVLTGGPGTGKTTCLKALIEVLESNNIVYALAFQQEEQQSGSRSYRASSQYDSPTC